MNYLVKQEQNKFIYFTERCTISALNTGKTSFACVERRNSAIKVEIVLLLANNNDQN